MKNMTKFEVLETCNFDLSKAKEMFDWLSDETVPVAVEVSTGCPILDFVDVAACPCAEFLHPVHLILKNGKRTSNLHEIKAMHLKLKDIRAIALPSLNGEEIYFYPKIGKDMCLLSENADNKDWKAEQLNELEAMFKDAKYAWDRTQELLELDSEAAKFVRENVGRAGYIPGIQQVFSIIKHASEINAITELIQGADKIETNVSFWSSCRNGTFSAWRYSGDGGFAGGISFCNTYGVLSCLLYQ